jgi:DNA-3-methyladenine glycosylase
MSIIAKDFFKQEATEAAPKLLGATLNRLTPSGQLKTGIIVETEAYMPNDPACHAVKGITKRTIPMFEEGGICYVYLIYGMYYCLNVVTGAKGSGQAVLIRALELLNEEKFSKAASGPGKLCRYFDIDKQQNGLLFSKENGIWFESPPIFQKHIVETSSRVGISVGKEKEWRFFIKGNSSVSRRK